MRKQRVMEPRVAKIGRLEIKRDELAARAPRSGERIDVGPGVDAGCARVDACELSDGRLLQPPAAIDRVVRHERRV